MCPWTPRSMRMSSCVARSERFCAAFDSTRGARCARVSSQARVSLGYLSEVERGQKEASSELLASICQALDAPLSMVLREVSDRIALTEGVMIPDTVPDELVRQQGIALR